MASKRKSKKIDTREQIMERRAYESMELALAEHQSDKKSTDEEEWETDDSSEEETEEVNASEDVQKDTQERTEELQDSAPEEAEETEPTEEAEETEPTEEAEETEPTEEAKEAEPTEENVVTVAPPLSSDGLETEGLPEKTAHDPTSHVVEDEETVGGEVLWFFLAMLAIAVLMLLFGN